MIRQAFLVMGPQKPLSTGKSNNQLALSNQAATKLHISILQFKIETPPFNFGLRLTFAIKKFLKVIDILPSSLLTVKESLKNTSFLAGDKYINECPYLFQCCMMQFLKVYTKTWSLPPHLISKDLCHFGFSSSVLCAKGLSLLWLNAACSFQFGVCSSQRFLKVKLFWKREQHW